MPATDFTIFRRVQIGLLDTKGTKVGTVTEDIVYHALGHTAQYACEALREALADEDERLKAIDPESPEYEKTWHMALRAIPGQFSVYAGKLTDRPDAPPLHEEGELGDPLYWREPAST